MKKTVDSKDRRALVIGFGSIGSRHVRLLGELGYDTAVVSARSIAYSPSYRRIPAALESHNPEYIVVANATSEHQETLASLARFGYKGSVLVEKPLFHRFAKRETNSFPQIYVAYNLRFHPVIQRLKSLLAGETIISILAYVGQYLPDWRPERDYRLSYSAQKKRGGGVLRDLSHELDYLVWILGGWKRLVAQGGHYSALDINSEDTVALMLETPLCPVVSVQLNYLDRTTRRFVVVNTTKHTIEADLIKGTMTIDHDVEKFNLEKDVSYRQMHKSILEGDNDVLCSFKEGLEVLRMIEAAELSIEQKKWVER